MATSVIEPQYVAERERSRFADTPLQGHSLWSEVNPSADRESGEWWEPLRVQTLADLTDGPRSSAGLDPLFGDASDSSASRGAHSEAVREDTPPTEGELANRHRVGLLAKKYVVSRLSDEDSARLEILTERVRALLPSVTPEDFSMLDAIESRRQSRILATEALLQNLGL
jgi:hypothetical protein